MLYIKIKLKYFTKANANALVVRLKADKELTSRLRYQEHKSTRATLDAITIMLHDNSLEAFKTWLKNYLEEEVFILALVITNS